MFKPESAKSDQFRAEIDRCWTNVDQMRPHLIRHRVVRIWFYFGRLEPSSTKFGPRVRPNSAKVGSESTKFGPLQQMPRLPSPAALRGRGHDAHLQELRGHAVATARHRIRGRVLERLLEHFPADAMEELVEERLCSKRRSEGGCNDRAVWRSGRLAVGRPGGRPAGRSAGQSGERSGFERSGGRGVGGSVGLPGGRSVGRSACRSVGWASGRTVTLGAVGHLAGGRADWRSGERSGFGLSGGRLGGRSAARPLGRAVGSSVGPAIGGLGGLSGGAEVEIRGSSLHCSTSLLGTLSFRCRNRLCVPMERGSNTGCRESGPEVRSGGSPESLGRSRPHAVGAAR